MTATPLTGTRPLGRRRMMGRFPHRQARRVMREVLVQVALVLLLIESIFVAEELISGLLEEVLKIGASLGRTLVLMAAMLPKVFELALPTALLIAVYRVALSLREDREFLTLSSVGIPPHALTTLVLKIGLAAQIAAFVVGGFVDPLARFAFRQVMFAAQYDALAGGRVTDDRLFQTRLGTVSVSPGRDGSPVPRLFVLQPTGEGERVVVADGARLTPPDEAGRVSLQLYGFVVDEFARRAGAEAGTGRPPVAPVSSLRGTSTQQSFVIADIIAFDPRGRDIAERTTVELLGAARTDERARLELGKRIGRGFLCLIAPLIAILALSFTTRANQAFVLPLACAGLMATEIFGTAALARIMWIGAAGSIGFIVTGGILIGVMLALAVTRRSSAIARPGLGRS
ncbi:MAG: LptF/LptG family permease [Phreatobacter sp.]